MMGVRISEIERTVDGQGRLTASRSTEDYGVSMSGKGEYFFLLSDWVR